MYALVAKLEHNDELHRSLEKAGCVVRVIELGHAMVVEPPQPNGSYQLLPELQRCTLRIDAVEMGGQGAELSQVICLPSGDPAQAYAVLQNNDVPWSPDIWQARFQSSAPLAAVRLTPGRTPLITIRQLRIVRPSPTTAQIESSVIWAGDPDDEVPSGIERFGSAIMAAAAKAACPQCRCAHYISP